MGAKSKWLAGKLELALIAQNWQEFIITFIHFVFFFFFFLFLFTTFLCVCVCCCYFFVGRKAKETTTAAVQFSTTTHGSYPVMVRSRPVRPWRD
jgi:hypothetical protein